MADASSGGRGRNSKVARLIAEYDLNGVGEELERKWTADGEDRRSLRTLADWFNRELLREALESADVPAVDDEVANFHRLLTDDDVSGVDRTRITRRLERQGVDVDDLTDEFVSYQAVRTYLKNHRDATFERSSDDMAERARTTIQRLRNRTTAVTETKIEQLSATDTVTLGEFRVTTDVRVTCTDCRTSYGIDELFEQGGCGCS